MLLTMQAWQAVHPPLRGRVWTRPRVHAGFLKSWLAGNLKGKVLTSVLKHLQDQSKVSSVKRVLVTGQLCSFGAVSVALGLHLGLHDL